MTERGQSSSQGETARSGSASVVRRRALPLRRSFIGDTIAITLILGAINYLLFRGDPCWLQSNPTPLLLLPILIGGRYGAGAGLFSGLLTTGIVIGVMHLLGTTPAELLKSHAMALVSFPIIGLLCGEIHSFFKAKTLALSERCDQLEDQHSRAAANLELYADSNTDLQKRLAVHGVRFTSLDSELRRLLAPSKNNLFTDSLALLNRVTEVSEAAFYTVGDKRQLVREALMGNGDELPEEFRSDEIEIVGQALAEKQMVTCRELWGSTPQLHSRHLAAIPLLDPHGEAGAVLLVRRLPFHCVTWQHFAQIETICKWIANIAAAGKDRPGEATDRDFEKTVALCLDTQNKHALPSSAVRFVSNEQGGPSQHELEEAVEPHMRSTDLTTRSDLDYPNVTVLLPMEGRDEAERLIEQVSATFDAGVETAIVQSEDLDSPERFLSRLETES